MTTGRVLGVDVGSRWCAATAIEPGIVLASGTLDINPDKIRTSRVNVDAAVSWLVGCAILSGAERIAVEHSEEWAPWPGMSPAAQKVTQANWTLCDRIVRALRERAPVPVEIIHARTWRSRVLKALPKQEKAPEDMPSRERRERTDALVRAALAAIFPPESVAILSALCPPCESAVHQRDAAGAAVGAILAPLLKPPHELRPSGPRLPRGARPATRNAGWLARRAAATAEKRAAAGCRCSPRQHRKGCTLYRRPAVYAVPAPDPRPCGCGPRGPHREYCPTRLATQKNP